MTMAGWTLILLFAALVVALAKPMGLWLFALYEGRSTPLHRVLGPVERLFYRVGGIDPAAEQSWRTYAVHMLLFQVALVLFTYAILRFDETPDVEVEVLNQPHEEALGAGEAAQGPACAAIVNAIYRANGKRIRDLPVIQPTS